LREALERNSLFVCRECEDQLFVTLTALNNHVRTNHVEFRTLNNIQLVEKALFHDLEGNYISSASLDDDVDEWRFYDGELYNNCQHAMDDVDMLYTAEDDIRVAKSYNVVGWIYKKTYI
jgi:hypothetical protein